MASLTAEEQEAVEELRDILAGEAEKHLFNFWQLGDWLNKKQAQEKKQPQRFRPGFVGRAAAALGFESEDYFRHAMLVAVTWPKKDSFARLVNRDMDGARYLTVGHVTILARIRDKDARDAMTERLYSERLTIRQLRELVGAESGLSRSSNNLQGRPPALPESPVRMITDVAKKSTALTRLMTDAWLSDEFDLVAAIEDAAPASLPDNLPETIRATRLRVNTLIANCRKLLKTLADAEQQATIKLGALDVTAESDEPADEDEES